jgi:hypothetical protein
MSRKRLTITFGTALFSCLAAPVFCAEPAQELETPSLSVHVGTIPEDGLVLSELSLQGLQRQVAGAEASSIKTVVTAGAREIPSQWVPDPAYDGRANFKGTLLLFLPNQRSAELKVTVKTDAVAAKGTAASGNGVGDFKEEKWFKTRDASISFDPRSGSLFPNGLQYKGETNPIRQFEWSDRVYNRTDGAFFLRNDNNARLSVVSDGPLATIVRGWARYLGDNAKPAPGAPFGTYDWYLFKNQPWVYAVARQEAKTVLSPQFWSEDHTLEWNFRGRPFDSYASDVKPEVQPLAGTDNTLGFERWGALTNGQRTVAMLGAKVFMHDGKPETGTYLQLMEPNGWLDWGGIPQKTSVWLWLGTQPDAIETVAKTTQIRTTRNTLSAEVTGVRALVAELRAAIKKLPVAQQPAAAWRVTVQETLLNNGEITPTEARTGNLPAWVKLARAGNLGLAFVTGTDGIQLISTYDLSVRQELLSQQRLPFLKLVMRRKDQADSVNLQSGIGWDSCRFAEQPWGFSIVFTKALEAGQTIRATVNGRRNAKDSEWVWGLDIANQTTGWSIEDVTFPQVTLADMGESMKVLLPYVSGNLRRDLFATRWDYKSTYPSSGANMQFMTAYREGAQRTGLYFGRYDTTASAKDIYASPDQTLRQLILGYSQPAENASIPGNKFTYQGTAVWRLLHGDWYDAAGIYRQWAKNNAPWWPTIAVDGRTSTPLWYKQLNAWINAGGENDITRASMEKVKKLLGTPVGAHWYAWHQIPFDNDYPHYFPEKVGLTEAVKALQAQQIYAMPYVNARLWDTKDKGGEDWKFTKEAYGSATKSLADGKLQLYTEESFPIEPDGKNVLFGVMCPYTKVWQDKITEICAKLTNDVGVKGIYLDQIAAGVPLTCMDPTHGHPLGGGHWWVDGYDKMLQQIRNAIPKDVILTSECNAESYMKYFDGYLVWNWQGEDMVPAFPTVYSGAVQFFGRDYAYKEGLEDIDLGMRMKASQELVFGEQLGWMPADMLVQISNEGSRQFFIDLVRTRQLFQKYFYAGQMMRPPVLPKGLPTLTANWNWADLPKVTLPAVQTGAWHMPAEKKLLMLFSNSSDAAVTTTFDFDPASYGLGKTPYRVTEQVVAKPASAAKQLTGKQKLPLQIPPLTTICLEVTAR